VKRFIPTEVLDYVLAAAAFALAAALMATSFDEHVAPAADASATPAMPLCP